MNGPRYAFRAKHRLDNAEKALDTARWWVRMAHFHFADDFHFNGGNRLCAIVRRAEHRVERLRRVYQKAMLTELARALKQRKSILKRAGK